ncbi:MAG: RnfABCDGE type electron transport complex subunit D [Phycisphaerales bacterium]|nr:RnfABCDGE type electron transport complex subunit D [Phycisphaerales bacterium]
MSETPVPAKPTALPIRADGPRGFLVSSPPHVAAGDTTQRIMFDVALAMLPLLAAAILYFGIGALVLVVVTTAGCLAAEAAGNWLRGRSQASLVDGSALVTGMILAFSLPPVREGGLNYYMGFLGGAVAIGLAKSAFGGLGNNLFNPAMVGRAFLMICFPAALGVWTEPGTGRLIGDPNIDAITMATPLQIVKQSKPEYVPPSTGDLFVGKVGGCIGETSALAALLGGLYLVLRRRADWRQPVFVLLGVLAVTLGVYVVWPGEVDAKLLPALAEANAAGELAFRSGLGLADTLRIAWTGAGYQLLSGALLFGAFFIATDYVGAPVNPLGRILFGLGVGVLIAVIRLFGAYPEGLMFAILIMNALTPLIERVTTPTPFGGHVKA